MDRIPESRNGGKRRVTLAGVLVRVGSVVGGVGGLGGCAIGGAAEARPAMVVRWEGGAVGRSFAVDLVPEQDAGNVRVDAYFGGKMPERAGRMVFEPGVSELSVAADSHAWKRWETDGVARLVVLADVPGRFVDLPAVQDPRRLVVSIEGVELPIAMTVGPSGVTRSR